MTKISAALLAYAASMVAANLLVAWCLRTSPHLLPYVVGANAFVLIGMDLALRDWLHLRLSPTHIGALIAGTGVLTYLFAPARVAFASAAAFLAAALADWAVFSRMRAQPWLVRANASNIVGAAVDSLVFPAIIGAFRPDIVLTMFATKVAGAALWSAMLSPSRRRPA